MDATDAGETHGPLHLAIDEIIVRRIPLQPPPAEPVRSVGQELNPPSSPGERLRIDTDPPFLYWEPCRRHGHVPKHGVSVVNRDPGTDQCLLAERAWGNQGVEGEEELVDPPIVGVRRR